MSNNKKSESSNFLGDAIRLLASKSAADKDARIAARKWIEEVQKKAKFAGLIRTLDSDGTYEFVRFLVEYQRAA